MRNIEKTILFCFNLPLTRTAFEEEVNNPKKDFVRHFIKDRKEKKCGYSWENYKAQLVIPYKMMRSGFSRYNFRFIDECTFADFKNLCGNIDFKAVTIFSHCINNGTPKESIEYFDHLVASENIVDSLPTEINRIYDFSVCASIHLKRIANLRRNKNIIGTSEHTIPLSAWIAIYAQVFTKIVLNKLPYLEAHNEVLREADQRIKQKLQT